MLDQHELHTLRATPLVTPQHKVDAAHTFYKTLFELSPELRDLFPSDLSDQVRKFSATLVIAINSLNDWQALQPVVEAIARRHVSYGVTKEHYGLVRHALVVTLNKLAASEEELEIWGRVYDRLARHMIETAHPEAA